MIFIKTVNIILWALIVICGIAPWSFAQTPVQMGLEFRTDAEINKSGAKSDPAENGLAYLFKIRRANFDLKGIFSQELQYRMRVRWNGDFDEQTDGSGLGLEYWYIDQLWSENLRLRFGKQFIQQGGREGSYNSLDVLKYSLMGERIQKFYEVGLSGIYNLKGMGLSDQILILQLLNQPGGGNERQKNFAYNLAWFGSVLDKMLDLVFQWGHFPHDRKCDGIETICGPDQEEYQPIQLLSLGTKVNLDFFKIDVDFLSGSFKGVNALEKRVEETNNSIVVLVQQKVSEVKEEQGNLYPFIKWVYDTASQNLSSAEDLKNHNGLYFGVEMFPMTGSQGYRWHAMFTYDQMTLKKQSYTDLGINTGISARFY